MQVYAWKQVQDGLRHRAIFSDPSEWPSVKKSRYHGLYDGPFFALHDTLMFLCEGTASFKEMTVRFGSLQVTCSRAKPASCSDEGGGVTLPLGLQSCPCALTSCTSLFSLPQTTWNSAALLAVMAESPLASSQ